MFAFQIIISFYLSSVKWFLLVDEQTLKRNEDDKSFNKGLAYN